MAKLVDALTTTEKALIAGNKKANEVVGADKDGDGNLTRKELARAAIEDYLEKSPDKPSALAQLQSDYQSYEKVTRAIVQAGARANQDPQVQEQLQASQPSITRLSGIIKGLPGRIIATVLSAQGSVENIAIQENKAAQAQAQQAAEAAKIAGEQAETLARLNAFAKTIPAGAKVPQELLVQLGKQIQDARPAEPVAPRAPALTDQQKMAQVLNKYHLDPIDFPNLSDAKKRSAPPTLKIEDLGKVLPEFSTAPASTRTR